MFMKKILFPLLIILMISNCSKNKDVPQLDSLIFGTYYGECMPSNEMCIETFKLTNTQLFEDELDDYDNTQFAYTPLSQAHFNVASDLAITFILSNLNNYPDSTFGFPDSFDQGGVFISVEENGVAKRWNIDRDLTFVPSHLHSLVNQVNAKVYALQDL